MLLMLSLLILPLFHPGSLVCGTQGLELRNANRKILLIIESGFINCPPCMKSFDEFIRLIKENSYENLPFGVLIDKEKEPSENREKRQKILEKQLKGFQVGNEIEFSIILDKMDVFGRFYEKSPLLILFDFYNNSVRKYEFPLSESQLREIFQ